MVRVSGSEGKGGGVSSALFSLSHIPSSLPIICVGCWGCRGGITVFPHVTMYLSLARDCFLSVVTAYLSLALSAFCKTGTHLLPNCAFEATSEHFFRTTPV